MLGTKHINIDDKCCHKHAHIFVLFEQWQDKVYYVIGLEDWFVKQLEQQGRLDSSIPSTPPLCYELNKPVLHLNPCKIILILQAPSCDNISLYFPFKYARI